MKRALLLIGMLLAFNAQAQKVAVTVTGSDLAEHCSYIENKDSPLHWAACVWYVTAIADVMALQPVGGWRACIPMNGSGSQYGKIVHKYFREHPGQLHTAAFSAVARALSEAFPCKK
jgi:Rap1a immunity proteins